LHSRLAPAVRDVGDALRFFTRLPIRGDDATPVEMNRIAWAAPVAGAVVGLAGSVVLALAQALGLPHVVGSGLATAALVAATGALHEDGLADVADGFGGGATRARKLEIMRDSRIGAFGATALALALMLRVGALFSALSHGFWYAAGALVLVSAVSRAGALTPLAWLDPARADGAGATAGRLEPSAFAAAWGATLAIAFVLGFLAVGLLHAVAAAAAAGMAAGGLAALARRQIGGQTGDVAGAAQQCAEIAAWCGLLAGVSAT
jgi:adenosylcobinamide-GDP ribazoletransferase